MYRILILFIFTLSITVADAQDWHTPTAIQDLDKKTKKQFEKSLNCLKKKKDQKSAQKLEKLLSEYPSVYEARKELARYYLNTKQSAKAKKHLESIDQSGSIHDLQVYNELLSLAEKEKNYSDAASYAKKILEDQSLSPTQRKEFEKSAKTYEFRAEAINNPVAFDPQTIGSKINTKDSEYLPAFNADGTILIYTSRNTSQMNSQEDLFYSVKDNAGNLSEGKHIEELRTPMNEGGHTFSQDGKILIFTSCDRRDSQGGCDLYISFLRDEGWSKPQNLGPEINGRFWESQPSLSADNSTLYFSSSRPGGKGQRDIWMSSYKSTGGWMVPVNLGENINTKGNEETPFIHPDNNSLYFQSDGHLGMGGTDIFISRRKNGNWSGAKNLGYPINDETNQGALFVDLSGNMAYYAREKKSQGYVDFDIYKFELPEEAKPENVSYIKLLVKDAQTKAPIQADITLNNLVTENSAKIRTDQNGFILKTIVAGNYGLSVDKEGYVFHSENIAVPKERSVADPLEVIIELNKIVTVVETEEPPTPVILKNIFFETGSAELLAESTFEINKLYELLSNNEQVRIMITGHTDNIGSDQDNQVLSEARAKSVYNALTQKGIQRSKIQYQGKGEAEPIADNNTEEGRLKNRRTEFYIIN